MQYPLLTDYISAIQVPESFATLQHLRPLFDKRNQPVFESGGKAAVFKMIDKNDSSKTYAVKVFLEESVSRKKNLSTINDYIKSIRINPYLTSCEYLSNEIWINENEYPVLIKKWIVGKTLSAVVAELCKSNDKETLTLLASRFDRLGLWMLERNFAHGDIKPDNIIITPDKQFRLIDYDGMFVPELSGSCSPELGTAEYRHPKRTTKDFNEYLDDFPILVLSLSLHVLSIEPSLYNHDKQGDALLFKKEDYYNILKHKHIEFFQQNTEDRILSRFGLLMGSLYQPVINLRELVGVLENTAEDFSNDLEEYQMVLVEGGSFDMGNVEFNDSPVHYVELESFYIGKYLVNQKQWTEVMGMNPSMFTIDDNPVENISWYDCISFCNKLSRIKGLNECYRFAGKKIILDIRNNGYRLPTEAEWEYAASGGRYSQGFKYIGGNNLDEIAWFNNNSRFFTQAIGLKKPNELGLFDMNGNVWEWCWDWVAQDYYLNSPTANPQGPSMGMYKIIRGGCYKTYGINEHVFYPSYREYCDPNNKNDDLGLRIVRNK